MNEPFSAGAVVVAYLKEPREKVWGVLRSLGAAGLAVEGVDLRSFDECVRGAASGDIAPGDISLAFYPLSRVEKLLLDRGTEDVPSLEDQFSARVGMGILEFLGR